MTKIKNNSGKQNKDQKTDRVSNPLETCVRHCSKCPIYDEFLNYKKIENRETDLLLKKMIDNMIISAFGSVENMIKFGNKCKKSYEHKDDRNLFKKIYDFIVL